MLWISAVSGAGKSYLYAFLVKHLQSIASADEPVLFYMFDGRNVDNNSSLSAACSLAYQLLGVAQMSESLLDTLNNHRVQTGQSKATDFEPLWDIVSKFIGRLSRFTLVLDGLDECEDRVVLLGSIIEILKNSNAKIIVLSRREADFIQTLQIFPQIRFGKTDNGQDILSFLQSRILSNDKLRKLSSKNDVLKRFGNDLATELSNRSDGSFLWAKTALREIESTATTSEIIAVIKGLPSDLKQFYEFILVGYSKRLDAVKRRICCMIFRWLICAARPLSGRELRAAIEYEYLHPNLACEENDDSVSDSELDSDDEFHITQTEIEELCGSLVITDGGSMKFAHISIVEFLRQQPLNQHGRENIDDFFVNIPDTNRHLMMVCVNYLQTKLGRRAIRREDRGKYLQFNATDESTAFQVYCICQWPFHLSESVKANLEPIKGKLKEFLIGSKMPYWLEKCIIIEGRNLWTLEQRMRTTSRWCTNHAQYQPSDHELTTFIDQWSKGILSLLERHGPSLEEVPSEIHFIDPCCYDEFNEDVSVFSKGVQSDSAVYDQHFPLHSKILSHCKNVSRGPDRRHKMDFPRRDFPKLTLFHVDTQRSVIFSASYRSPSPELRCQEILTGHKLEPMRFPQESEDRRAFYCEGSSISPDGKYLALMYFSGLLTYDADTNYRYDIIVWKLAEQIDIGNNDTKAWCEVVKTMSYEKIFIGSSPRPLAIDTSNNFYSFLGCVRIEDPSPVEAAIKPIPTASVGGRRLPESIANLRNICFSADCRFLIAYDQPKLSLLRFLVEDMTLCSTTKVSNPELLVCCVSYSGRFVVWRHFDGENRSCYLHDFEQDHSIEVPASEEISTPLNVSLKFTLNEDSLIGIMDSITSPGRHCISIWSPLSSAIQQFYLGPVQKILGFHLTNVDEPAYLASLDRWTEVDLARLELSKYQPELYVAENPHIHRSIS